MVQNNCDKRRNYESKVINFEQPLIDEIVDHDIWQSKLENVDKSYVYQYLRVSLSLFNTIKLSWFS